MSIRASDDDRRRAVAALERHTGAGRLTLDEFAERVQVAHDARTLDQLSKIMADLPPDEPTRPSSAPGARPARPRGVPLLLAIASAALLLLSIFLTVTAR